jgi:hypothetical protein
MSRGTKIARALSRSHDKLRSIFLEGVCLKLYDVTSAPYVNPIATFADRFYLDKREYSDVIAGKKFKRLVIDDLDGCRLSKLKAMTAVQIGNIIYKFHAKDSFIGSVPSYEFKVYPTGEQI